MVYMTLQVDQLPPIYVFIASKSISLNQCFKSILQRHGRTALRDCSDTTLWDLTTTSPHTGTTSNSELASYSIVQQCILYCSLYCTAGHITHGFLVLTGSVKFICAVEVLPSKGMILLVHTVLILKCTQMILHNSLILSVCKGVHYACIAHTLHLCLSSHSSILIHLNFFII